MSDGTKDHGRGRMPDIVTPDRKGTETSELFCTTHFHKQEALLKGDRNVRSEKDACRGHGGEGGLQQRETLLSS